MAMSESMESLWDGMGGGIYSKTLLLGISILSPMRYGNLNC